MTTINKHYVSRLYYLHHELAKAIDMLAREMWEENLTAFAETLKGLAMTSNELETIFAEVLTEDERATLQAGNKSLDTEAEADVVDKIENLLDDLAGDDE
jgi:hypothetical protein